MPLTDATVLTSLKPSQSKHSYLVRYHVCHGGLDEAWQDDVDPDAELAELLGGGLGEADDPGLTRRVVCLRV